MVLLVLAGGAGGVMYHMLRGTPDWYQQDDSTADQKRSAADRVEDLLARLRDHVIKPSRAKLDERRKQELAKANQQSAEQAEQIKSEQADAPFELEFTDAQLNAFFERWKVGPRQEMFDEYVENPRIAIRNNQLIFFGKYKSNGIILSLIFEPKIDDKGNFLLNLVRVQGGMLSVPDAMWAGKRDSIAQMLKKKLPAYQADASALPDGCVNGGAGSAAMNEMLLAVLSNAPTPAVVLVPANAGTLVPSIPVKITAMTVANRSLKMTAQKMTPEEQAAYLKTIKTAEKASAE